MLVPPHPAASRVAAHRLRVRGFERARWVAFLTLLWGVSAGFLPRAHPGESGPAYWSAGLVATLLFFGSVKLHEHARALAARRVPGSALRLALLGALVSGFLSVTLLFGAGWYAFFTPAWPVLVDVLRYGSALNLALAAVAVLSIVPLGWHTALRRVRSG